VIIFHPRHDLTLARLAPSDIETIIEQWKAIYNKRGTQQGIKYVQIFEVGVSFRGLSPITQRELFPPQNKGPMMGSSNPHPHGQVWSLSQVPSIPSAELVHMRQYAESSPPPSSAPAGPLGKPSLLCEYAHFEVNQENPDEGRVVVKNDDWVVLVPWWAVWPFETLGDPFSACILTNVTTDNVGSSQSSRTRGTSLRYCTSRIPKQNHSLLYLVASPLDTTISSPHHSPTLWAYTKNQFRGMSLRMSKTCMMLMILRIYICISIHRCCAVRPFASSSSGKQSRLWFYA
jgi:Galactose-1-phosphate uridyl transferase, N-terminal domain/Galactose-1-phosphate uridyl transferase, C-terminal domain